MTYIELASDHAMTAFLASLTPGKVLRDRQATFSKPERKRQRYLREKTRYEFTESQLRVAREWHERQQSIKEAS